MVVSSYDDGHIIIWWSSCHHMTIPLFTCWYNFWHQNTIYKARPTCRLPSSNDDDGEQTNSVIKPAISDHNSDGHFMRRMMKMVKFLVMNFMMTMRKTMVAIKIKATHDSWWDVFMFLDVRSKEVKGELLHLRVVWVLRSSSSSSSRSPSSLSSQ